MPREVVWWALRYVGVDEWIVSVIRALYKDATTKVRLNGRERNAFSVRVGVHQGSVLSPLLFIIVLEALSREFREGLPMELLYAGHLVLMKKSEELLMEKLRKWKKGMEAKGLRVNVGKTKVIQCRVSRFQNEDSGKYPCGVCRKGVGDNSIRCAECLRWVEPNVKLECVTSGVVRGAEGAKCPRRHLPLGRHFQFKKATLQAAFSVQRSNTTKAAFSVQKSNPKGGIFGFF